MILSAGPLTGTGTPGSARFEITAISPKTALPVSSNCGGNVGVLLKKAGYDALILRGRRREHRWLKITETVIRFHDANDLWGAGTVHCLQQLMPRHTRNPFGYLCIGPAGEGLLPSATVVSGGRCVGKAGFGAILGWKNRKAITVSGNKTVPLLDSLKTMEELREKEASVANDQFDGIKAEARYVTVNEMFDLWCQLKRGLKNNTFENYKYMFNTFVRPNFGKLRLSILKKPDVKRFYNSLADELSLKASTIDNIHTVLHQVLTMAVDDNYIRANPSDNVLKELKQSHVFKTEKRPYTPHTDFTPFGTGCM